jgi:predicted HTH transcriptional regulator
MENPNRGIKLFQNKFYFHRDIMTLDENEHLDYKNYKNFKKLDYIDKLKNLICSFLNYQGGIIFLGVDDDSR